MDLQGFGNGQDGAVTLSGTDAPIDSSCSGTGGTKSLSATNASFAEDRIIFIHQSRGTGCGSWEFNVIDAYAAGTITTLFNLANTYYDSGNDQAQVIMVKEYSEVTISGTLTVKAWDGNVGGIIIHLCSGDETISGTVSASGGTGAKATSNPSGGGTGGGFRGGNASFARDNSYGSQGYQGEGSAGDRTSKSSAANGTGGGGGTHNNSAVGQAGAAGGGGHYASGAAGQGGAQGGGGAGGGTGGAPDMATMQFGGGGGGGGGGYNYASDEAGGGGAGGGIIFILAKTITITGIVKSDGGNGGTSNTFADGSTGGGGAGGSIYLVAEVMVVGTTLVHAYAGAGGLDSNGNTNTRIGGAGSVGRIYLKACTLTGTTSPSAYESTGGHAWCVVPGSIY